MKASEFRRWLMSQGIEIQPDRGKGGHMGLRNPANGKRSVMPTGRKELKTGTVVAIKKQLGLK